MLNSSLNVVQESGINQDNIIQIKRHSESELQLICFPFVGGNGNSLNSFIKILDFDMEIITVNPPGHSFDSSQLIDNIDELAELYIRKLSGKFREKTVFFGHSMGALVAYSLITKLAKHSNPLPSALIISASNAPPISERKSHLDDNQFINFIKSLGGIDDELLDKSELLRLFLPIIRSDFNAIETFHADKVPLDLPVYIFAGERDTLVLPEDIWKWQDYFTSKIEVIPVDGDHMYIKNNPQIILPFLHKIFTEILLI